jgi:NAD(P)-dependent dehydrogenase (short-subunit alcohol dehydrogenase family)
MESSVTANGRRLLGRIVLVTGASSGMGRAIALACAREGADLVLVARRRHALEEVAAAIRQLGQRALAAVADLEESVATDRAFAGAIEEFGRIDVVVHAAGTNIRERALTVLSTAGWAEVIDGNLTTAYHVTRAAVLRLRGQGGRIIYISSMAVQRPDTSGIAYQASKHAVVGLAHGTMQEERANGIRTTVVFPGLTETPLLLKRPMPTPPEVIAKALQPEDVAAACVFVASLPQRANVSELQLVPSDL